MKRYSLPVLLALFTLYPSMDGDAAVVYGAGRTEHRGRHL